MELDQSILKKLANKVAKEGTAEDAVRALEALSKFATPAHTSQNIQAAVEMTETPLNHPATKGERLIESLIENATMVPISSLDPKLQYDTYCWGEYTVLEDGKTKITKVQGNDKRELEPNYEKSIRRNFVQYWKTFDGPNKDPNYLVNVCDNHYIILTRYNGKPKFQLAYIKVPKKNRIEKERVSKSRVTFMDDDDEIVKEVPKTKS